MGMDLRAANGKYACTSAAHWFDLLKKAEELGWEPMGTVLTRDYYPYSDDDIAKWPGRYVSNDAQVILEEDAKALAAALRRMSRADYIEFCLKGYEDLWQEHAEPDGHLAQPNSDSVATAPSMKRADMIRQILEYNLEHWEEGLEKLLEVLDGGRVWIA